LLRWAKNNDAGLLVAQAYSYSCLTPVPAPGFIGVAYETVLPGSAIKPGASANNIVFTLVPQNFTHSSDIQKV
jgi:hypothetical protein